ncbi:MAG: CotH kinase family protein [Balneolaceae bacterium]|nr:CotH kinase family protein [Balneolaceae bacterium]
MSAKFRRYIFSSLLAGALCLFGFSNHVLFAQTIHLNEIMASNNLTIADEDGDFEDWIEIYNSGSEPLQLGGYGLSDDYDNPFRWVFPDTTIAAGEFMLIWASNKNRAIAGEPLHTNYAISAAGEEVILTDPNGTRIDELEPTEIPTDISLGRQPDGTGQWVYFDEPTPGASNSTEPLEDILEPAQFSHQPGFYTTDFSLELSHTEEGVTLYYTLDGSTPTTNSAVYYGPISIYNRTSEPNDISTIRTTYMADWRRFRAPSSRINKGNTVRVLAVKNGYKPSVNTGSFFVFPDGGNTHNLAVVSINTDRENLFGHERGIYVPGALHESGDDGSGNYEQRGIEWEREASLEFFDETGELKFAQNAGLRIHGGFTRRFAQKSFRLYARSEYGESRFNYKIFPDQDYNSYNRLLLRNSGNDQSLTMIRDAVAHELVSHFNMDTQAYRPAVVYINGEYWGIKNFRERYDRHYLERVYGIDPDNIDLLTGRWDAKEGDNQNYAQMLTFLENNNLANNARFEEITRMIDIDHFLDYYSAQIYFANTDWPHNNIDFWRLRRSFDPNAPKGHDGRWRWLFYDIDFTFGLSGDETLNMLDWVTQRLNFRGAEWPNFILRNLLENEGFRYDFINRMADHLNTAFQPERVLEVIERKKVNIEPEMARFGQRWYYPRSISQWEEFMQPMIQFAENRPHYLRSNIVNHFDLGGQAEISIDVNDAGSGTIQVNSITISQELPGISSEVFPWSGIYFEGVPVKLKPVPTGEFQFAYWIVDGEQIFSEELSVMPGSVREVTAHFDTMQLSVVESFQISSGYYLFAEWGSDQPAGTYPGSMAFVYMDAPDPGLDAAISGVASGSYDFSSRTRINGLGDDGFSFINTTNPDGNPGYPGTRLGGAVLALDTREITGAEVAWQAGTVTPNSRIYNLRLQYRVGEEGAFQDVTDRDGNPVEYERNAEESHSEFMGPVSLPEDAIGHERVELLWRYYYTGVQLDPDSNQRSELNISLIHVAAVSDEDIPEPHILKGGAYEFTSWPADAEAGTAPPSMAFAYMNLAEPGLDAAILGYTAGEFNLESRSRVNGLGEAGFSFINTANLEGNPGYPGRRIGGAVLALNTEGQGSVEVNWTAGTVLANSRIYNLRLQYRTSTDEPFRDVLDREGNPVEYQRSEFDGHSLEIDPVILPGDADDQPYLQLFWRYYFTGERVDEDSGQRSQLNISTIRVSAQPLLGGNPGTPEEFKLFQNYPNPFYPHTTIRYDLPTPQHVRIDLYTITGRHVATLENRQAQQGRHSVDVDAGSLASGIYIYRLVSDDFVESGRMSVIK